MLLATLFFIWHFMVVRHNHRHAEPPAIGNLLTGRDAVITRHYRVYPISVSPLDQLDVQTVSIFDTVRDITVYLSTRFIQTLQQDIRGIHAVYIVITDNTYLPAPVYLLPEYLYRLVHVLHEHAVIQVGNRPVQIPAYGFRADHVPVPDKAGQPRADSEFFPDGLKICSFSEQHPLFHSLFLHCKQPQPYKYGHGCYTVPLFYFFFVSAVFFPSFVRMTYQSAPVMHTDE